jgi:hypothetical protein
VLLLTIVSEILNIDNISKFRVIKIVYIKEIKKYVNIYNISSKYENILTISYPPNSIKVIKIQINIILAYSPKKKKTNIPAACSVINPLTNSDSASAKSKGALLVSAIEAIKKI